MPTVETAKLCVQDIRAAENDDDCVGVITWMHTFSPANVIAGIRRFAEAAKAIDLSRDLTVAAFGNNMRDVAVTDGNRLGCQIRYGWEIKCWGIGFGPEGDYKISAFGAVLMKMSENREGVTGDDTTEADIRKF